MYRIEQADCFEWLRQCPGHSMHAVCTDPPYGILEFTEKELAKLRAGRGGVWRLPPKMGGSNRDPLPRFTVLTEEQKQHLRDYFRDWGRPKNSEAEFPELCVSPKGAYEPWMLFRKPIDTQTVAENLRRWKTGALRRLSADKPLPDAIPSGRTPRREEAISDHPCLKPQHFMRIIVRALLPLGEGSVLDPFMGSGSTIAAARAVGYTATGLELDAEYFRLAEKAIPCLAALYPEFKGQAIDVELNGSVERDEPEAQLALVLAEVPSAYKTRPRKETTRGGGRGRPQPG